MTRAREARARRSHPWLRCGSARQTVQHHATTRWRGQPQPCRSEGIHHVVAARPGVFVHFSHVMNTTAPTATPGRRPFSAGAPGITHGPRHPERAHAAPVAERGVERMAASLDVHGHARGSPSAARSAGPVWSTRAPCARGATAEAASTGLQVRPCPAPRSRTSSHWVRSANVKIQMQPRPKVDSRYLGMRRGRHGAARAGGVTARTKLEEAHTATSHLRG